MNRKFGLTTEEVKLSAEKYGKNSLLEKEEESFKKRFGKNLGIPIMKVFIAALIVYIVCVVMRGEKLYEAIGIAAGIVILVYLVTYFEKRNDQILGSLKKRTARTLCHVFRDGFLQDIYIDEIVVGDAVLIQKGDIVPADGIILEGKIELDQSVLTGDMTKVKKEGVLTDAESSENLASAIVPEETEDDFTDENRVFKGSAVCVGNAVFKVTSVGKSTAYGRIFDTISNEDEERKSPLNLRLYDLSKRINVIGSICAIIVAADMVFQRLFVSNNFYMYSVYAYMSDTPVFVADLMMAVMVACAIILMCTPERVNYVISYMAARNTKKLLKNNVLVKKLNGLETSGTLRLLIADKTGVLTQGDPDCIIFIDGMNNVYKNISDFAEGLRGVLVESVLGNTSGIFTGYKDDFTFYGGNTVERAMAKFVAGVYEGGIPKKISSIPFDSNVKMSAATLEDPETESVTLIKGIPENIIDRCGYYYAENGKKLILSEESKEDIFYKIEKLADKEIRVVAFATSDEPISEGQIPMHGNWALVGVAGIEDDVRLDTVQALRELTRAGVQTIMITGDSVELAKAIAEDMGLVQWDQHRVLSAEDMASMTDNEIKAIFPDIRVIARATPNEKKRILAIAKSMDLVTGVTGSAVDDTEDVLKADVGFAIDMGHNAVKEAADIVLLDNSIASVVKALLYGRTFFNNIRKYMTYKLTVIFSAILVMLVIPAFGREIPLTVIHLIWINIIINIIGIALFAGEAPLKKYLREKPKSKSQKIITKKMVNGIMAGVIWCGFVSAMLFLLPALSGIFRSRETLLCGYLAYFVFTHIFSAFNARTESTDITANLNSNEMFSRLLWLVCLIQVLIVYLGGIVFRSTGLNVREWITVLIAAVLIIPMDIMRKNAYGNKPEEPEEVDLTMLLMDMEGVTDVKDLPADKQPVTDEGYDEEPFEEEDDGQPDTVFEDIGEIGDKTLEEVISEYEAFEEKKEEEAAAAAEEALEKAEAPADEIPNTDEVLLDDVIRAEAEEEARKAEDLDERLTEEIKEEAGVLSKTIEEAERELEEAERLELEAEKAEITEETAEESPEEAEIPEDETEPEEKEE